MRIISAAVVGALLAGCAQSSNQIGAAYVSPVLYESYSCTQLGEEAERVSARAAQLAGQLDQKATNDAVAVGVGLVLFWPALLLIGGNGPEGPEFARLKGQKEAIEQAAARRSCKLKFQTKSKNQNVAKSRSSPYDPS